MEVLKIDWRFVRVVRDIKSATQVKDFDVWEIRGTSMVRSWLFAAISVGENYTYLIAAFRLEAELHLLQLPIAANDP